jgi:pyruvate dehydrogenase E2 component (dihydrolipoamide acetyltransferase)
MAHPILMPKPGQMTEECVLIAWHKREGDRVRRGDVLFEIETDKANMDVESFEDGVLLRRYVEEGDIVPVNAVCAYVGEPGETVPDVAPERPAGEPARIEVVAEGPLGPATAASTGPAEATPTLVAPATTPSRPTAARAGAQAEGRLRISPRASRLAADAGIDPRTITGTGPEGRITERDVRAALAAHSTATVTASDDEAPRALSRMRRIIAERLTLSATTVPQFTVTIAVDMTRLVALKAELKAAGVALSVTDFVISAVARSLVEYPTVNARTDGVSIWPRTRVHLGLAVALPDGLVVPVIRDADNRSVTDLHARADALANAARNGTLGPDDMTGSTFTISNLGMYGVEEFSAIINPGESAILAVSSVIPAPVVVGDGIGIRQMMKLTLTADHRIVDGELAARFLNAVRRRLEDVSAYRSELLNR